MIRSESVFFSRLGIYRNPYLCLRPDWDSNPNFSLRADPNQVNLDPDPHSTFLLYFYLLSNFEIDINKFPKRLHKITKKKIVLKFLQKWTNDIFLILFPSWTNDFMLFMIFFVFFSYIHILFRFYHFAPPSHSKTKVTTALSVKLNFLIFFFIGASATKRFAMSRIFRYGCLMIILSNRQKKRRTAPPPHELRGLKMHTIFFSLLPQISTY